MTNEIKTTENMNTEVMPPEIVRETNEFVIMKDENGKFIRKAKFIDYSSFKAETKEEKIWLLELMSGDDEENANGLKDHVGKQIVVQDIITRTYDKINEDSGQQEFGVLTYLITPEKVAYVTSSKSVYFKVNEIMALFGRPDEEDWKNITVKVIKKKGKNGDIINIKMVG